MRLFVPDFAMLDLGDERYAVSAVSIKGHQWMKVQYSDYDPLRGRVLVFSSFAMADFVRSVTDFGLKVDGVNVRVVE